MHYANILTIIPIFSIFCILQLNSNLLYFLLNILPSLCTVLGIYLVVIFIFKHSYLLSKWYQAYTRICCITQDSYLISQIVDKGASTFIKCSFNHFLLVGRPALLSTVFVFTLWTAFDLHILFHFLINLWHSNVRIYIKH